MHALNYIPLDETTITVRVYIEKQFLLEYLATISNIHLFDFFILYICTTRSPLAMTDGGLIQTVRNKRVIVTAN